MPNKLRKIQNRILKLLKLPILVKVKLKHGEEYYCFESQIPLLQERGLLKEKEKPKIME